MVIKLNTGPALEPVQVSDVLTHCRLDSTTLADNLVTQQSIKPGAHVVAASYTLIGTGISIAGYRAVVNLNSGTNGSGGTVDVKIQESDDNTTFTDWTGGAFTQVTEANDNAIQEKEYTGSKPYIRAVATVGTATCDFSVDVVLSQYTPSDATYISNLITIARKHVENNVLGGVALINQTWEYYLQEFPKTNYIELPRPPIQSSTATSVKYTEDGDTTAYANTFSSTNYSMNTVAWPGRVQLYSGMVWPSASLETNEPVKVTFLSGYGSTRSSVPIEIRQCILMYVDDLYQHRGIAEVFESGTRVVNNPAADLLVEHYRLRHY